MVVQTPSQPQRLARLHELRGELIFLDNDEPANYTKAMMDLDSKKWQSAMRSEIDSIEDNQVWNLVDAPDGVRPIECKWIYKKKKDMDGIIHIYKA